VQANNAVYQYCARVFEALHTTTGTQLRMQSRFEIMVVNRKKDL